MVKGGYFTLLNADWGAEIIGGSLEVGELLKSRGWWAPTQPTPPGWQTLPTSGVISKGNQSFKKPRSNFRKTQLKKLAVG